MSTRTPIACIYKPQAQTSILSFSDNTGGEYWLRGGISWPVSIEQRDRTMPGLVKRKVIGHAVLCGMNINTNVIEVFDHTAFNAVELHLDAKFQAVNKPVVPFLLNAWSKYHALDWYWHEAEGTNRQFRTGLERADGLQPKPSVLFVPWDDDRAAEHTLWMAASSGMLILPGDLYQEIKEGESDAVCPAKHALVCALMGMQRQAYMKPEAANDWE
jgi:hypothetical protein